MKTKHFALRLVACGLAAHLAVQPALAQVAISQVPLASAGGNNILPNLLFTLDNSGSMDWAFVPDYVDTATASAALGPGSAPNNPCMTTSTGSTLCTPADPPYAAGGEHAMNGVGYDPTFSYLAGIDSTGLPHVNPTGTNPAGAPGTLNKNAAPQDAYGIQSTATTDLDAGLQDRRYCNTNNVCKRNGQTDVAFLTTVPSAPAVITSNLAAVSGPDDSGHTMSLGQFPYRANAANASFGTVSTVTGGVQTTVFGLPEMMSRGTFSRASSGGATAPVTVTTLEPHGLTTSDKIFVTGTGTSSVDLSFVAVATTPAPTANSFSFTSTAATALPNGGTGTFSRSGTTVTVNTSAAHGMASGATVAVNTVNTQLNTGSAVITVSSTTRFTYTVPISGTVAAINGTWSRPIVYRKYVAGNFSRLATLVTVNSTAHGLVSKDIVTTFVAAGNAMNATSVTVTRVDADNFTYTTATSGAITPAVAGFWLRTGLYNVASTVSSQPAVAYRITPVEFCTDAALTDCIEITPPPAAAPSDHPNPAYVRFCRTQEEAIAHGAITFIPGSPRINRCQAKYVESPGLQPYQYPRYGWFIRDTIKSANEPFTGRTGRVDCAAPPKCTYQEEIQNYAKWFAYYSTRMQMMKTSVGIAFRGFISNPSGTPPKPDSLRVGFITIHANDNGANIAKSGQYLKINTFNTTQAGSFYSTFYNQSPGGATPLREALARAGWIFAGKLGTGITAGILAGDDPVQISCQKNYSLLTTDGFWNSPNDPAGGLDLGGVNFVGNLDNNPNLLYTPAGITPAYTDPVSSRATGTYDGNLIPAQQAGVKQGGAGTLADVALYYYMTDLRGSKDILGNATGPAISPNGPLTAVPPKDVSVNNVPSKAGNKDFAEHQHMVTFTLGLADGLMSYQLDYETAKTGDFANIKSGAANACFWATGTCDWPVPQQNQSSALDDLWHAAVNGRGQYFQALNPRTLTSSLQTALFSIAATTGSASAAATSSPNITPKDNFAFSTTYQTNTWSGIVRAQRIDPVSGDILPTILWKADEKLLTQVDKDKDARSVWMFDSTAPNKLKKFDYSLMTSAEKAFFIKPNGNAICPTLSQCPLLSTTQQSSLNSDGTALVNFLRGQTGNELTPTNPTGLFRDRVETDSVTLATLQTVLGDIVDATPAYVRVPEFNYTDSGYLGTTGFKETQKTRPGALYVAANDGFLHAFDNTTDVNGNPVGTAGLENFAYMPKFVMPGIYQVADTNYANAHRFMLDGSPETGDVFDATAKVWKTILVGGANAGAQGFYALDITDPKNPQGLWEFCSDATLCPNTGSINHSDADLGFSYGNPVIGKLFDGTWVVILTSGLNNNAGSGTGVGFFYVLDAITGKVLHKVSTGRGDKITPLGLMKHAGFYKQGLVDATISYVYGGDLQGNVWRMDVTAATATVAPTLIHMATLRDKNKFAQPITTRPVATNYKGFRIVYFGTGRYLASTDPSDTSQQSIYGFKDKDADWGDDIRNDAKLVAQVLATGTKRTISTNTVDWSTQFGFFIDLNPGNDSPGERIILDPRLELGTLIFTSNIPIIGGCIPGGDSVVYNLDFTTGSYVPGTQNGIAGVRQGAFLVGSTPIQTTDGSIRTINTDSSGGLGKGDVNINKDPKAISRFSYRER